MNKNINSIIKAKIYPSILSCDLANIERDCKTLMERGADGLHIDIIDG